MQPVIKWTGSKRIVAKELVPLIPKYKRYFEPFVGGGSMTFYQHDVIASDINEDVIALWKKVRDYPEAIFNRYQYHWNNLQTYGKDYYFEVRKTFNITKNPYDFFFLNRTCTGGIIRYNAKGEFNTAYGYGRNGIQPENLKPILNYWSEKIQDYEYLHRPYYEITEDIETDDFVFCDPPYENTHSMYFGDFYYDHFKQWLMYLSERGVRWMTTTRTVLPEYMYTRVTTTSGGNSSLRTLAGAKQKRVDEFVYMNY